MAKKTTARKATAPAAPDVEVVNGPVPEDQQLVTTNISAVTQFFSGLRAFFTTAVALEKQAKERLDIARQFERELTAAGVKHARTEEEDVKAQLMIRASKVGRKTSDEHWGITAVLSQLHKATVAGRERAGKMDDEAAEIAQRLHNGYAEAERRRVAQENEDRRLEAERVAREERAREAAELERKAVEAEEKSPTLSERETTFVNLVHSGVTAQHAAERAGFADPLKTAARLTSSPKIQAALNAKREAETIRTQAAARAERPLEVEVQTVRPNITRATPGGHDRTTWSGEVLDERLFIEAVIGGKHGIPADVLQANPAKLNEYARSMQTLIDRWPGVRSKKSTTTV